MDSNTINALSGFLEWGAVGLAGLMMVLAILALISGTLTPERAGLLRTFLYVGAVCFMAALGAQVFTQMNNQKLLTENQNLLAENQQLLARKLDHNLSVGLWPNDLASVDFPEPKIQSNGKLVDRTKGIVIDRPTSLSIDISEALDKFEQNLREVEQAQRQVATVQQELTEKDQEIRTVKTEVARTQNEVARLERQTTQKEQALTETTKALEARETELAEKERKIAEVVEASAILVREIQTIEVPAPEAIIVGPTEPIVNQIGRDISRLADELKLTIDE